MPNPNSPTTMATPSLPQFKQMAAYILPDKSLDALNEAFTILKTLNTFIGCKGSSFEELALEDRAGVHYIMNYVLSQIDKEVLLELRGLSAKALSPYIADQGADHE